ncbi:galactosylceramide sulfotransferase isoform X1 [Polypterus senegalus]|uniref:galactosylceramide sulfotransferase isoform X1 n=1 Tax=Polypterus senegalus TaxID=55291 RepID=UPI0019639E4D|nr:galactosylceramide sulfotransferase isoform X1 [Polypterus senegalus]
MNFWLNWNFHVWYNFLQLKGGGLFGIMLPKQVKHWKSMCKGLVLGTLVTSCMILLYSYATPTVHLNIQEAPVPYSCDYQPVNIRALQAFNTSQNAQGRGAACTPKVDIMFMKTHKTASSTILNILFRFGQKHRLKFAFPESRNDFLYPASFQRSHVKDYQPGMCFNIICNHMRFNEEEVRKLLPADTIYFTIIRDPADLFESSFHYFGRIIPFTWKISADDKLAEFLRDPWHYYDPEGFNSFYLKNLLFFDFGYDNNLNPDDGQVDKSIKAIENRFDLVMLLEYFDESLILLKDILCLDMEDILYFKLNARKDSPVSRLPLELRSLASDWNKIDLKLYNHFNATFWNKVKQYGNERMALDVAELQRRNAEMTAVCIEGGQAVESSLIQESSMQPWQPIGEKSILGYNLKKNIDKKNRKLCRKMLTPEIQYLTELGVNLWITKLWAHIREFLNW